MASWLTVSKCFCSFSKLNEEMLTSSPKDKLRSGNSLVLPAKENVFSRRRAFAYSGATLTTLLSLDCGLRTLPVRAVEKELKEQEGEEDKGLVGTITSLFDPNEKTKSGKLLPKTYLNSAREVVKTLRDSLKEDPKDNAKFRRTADAAKESIREYLSDWRGQTKVVTEESYIAIEKAIRSLASFYSKAGPSASLPEEVKSNILEDLNTAEANL
ncbi:Photosystem ii d1 processing protein psb27-h2 protein [Thalictrum thalictroides]|uniref:Photosystem ii d1 processing protein psb27-h2 protein n=1 Tax=Thalictrum thalictroides TaxID=46969 RepID=A0A7J6UWC8_THATH|nr:Photosystem ii d1 processing protein psb27-h2 protein [Thalictrum thalictroides]